MSDGATVASDLHGDAPLFFDHIVVFDHGWALSVRTLAGLAADPWTPGEKLVDLELDQSQQEDAQEEVTDQDNAVAFKVVPCPDLGWDLPWDNLTVISHVFSPRLDEQSA